MNNIYAQFQNERYIFFFETNGILYFVYTMFVLC